jgi:hypothetical protein
MMTVGDIRAAAGVVRTLRIDDWLHHLVEAQVAQLAEDYTHEDVLYACVVIARDPSNRAPMTLSLKAPDIIAKLHAKTAGPRTPGPDKIDKGRLCFVCNRREDRCQSSAANQGDDHHAFVSMRDAEAQLGDGHRTIDLPAMRTVE